MKKKIWLRLGVTVKVTEEEFDCIRRGEGEDVLREHLSKGDFYADGDSYIPATKNPCPDEWPVEEEINLEF
jgi:hypothetical protein